METDVEKGCCYKYMGLGVVAYPCNLSTGKEEQRQEDYEFKGSLEYISLRPAWLHRDPLSVKLRVGPRKMAQVLRTCIALTGPKSSSLTLCPVAYNLLELQCQGIQEPLLASLRICIHVCTPPPQIHAYI